MAAHTANWIYSAMYKLPVTDLYIYSNYHRCNFHACVSTEVFVSL